MKQKRIIVGISGASGAVYGIRMLEVLKELGVETHLVISKAAHITVREETEYTLKEIKALASYAYTIEDIGAAIASGSYPIDAMMILPCSVSSLAHIAHGTTNNLLTRAADVTLKERRPLILSVRETPLHLGHLRNMAQATEMGAIITPPMPAFYNHPETLDDIINHHLGRVLDLLHIESKLVKRWKPKGNV